MAFTPVNEIERLLLAATRDPASRPDFYRALTEHDLLVVGEAEKPAAGGSSGSEENTPVRVQMIEVQGKPHVPIFTSKERVAAVVKGETPYIAMNGRALFTMVRGSDLVMNPGSEYGKLFVKAEVEAILDGTILQMGPTQNVGGQQVLLSQPKDYPRHITDALARFFPRQSEISAAYLAQASFPKLGQTPHTMIGIETTGDWKALMGEAGLIVQSVVRAGEIVDFVRLSQSENQALNDYFRSTAPFYQRASHGGDGG